MQNSTIIDTVIDWAATTGIKVIIAIILLLICFKVIGKVTKTVTKKMEETGKFDQTLTKTLAYLINIGLKVLVVICLIGYLGIETSGLSALVASMGVCAGLAVNGTLSNLAGGVMILLTRPFKLGDYISAQGSEGTVQEIMICYTKIRTVDNKIIYLPNSALSTGVIVNYSEDPLRRVDLDFSVAGNDPAKVRQILLKACENEPLVLQDPAPFARITDYANGNGMKLTLRAWCKSGDYWDVYLNLLDSIHDMFEAENIAIPFGHVAVHMKND